MSSGLELMSESYDESQARFAAATREQGAALARGDHVTANAMYDEARAALAALRSRHASDNGVAALRQLLDDDSLATVKTAAYFLLPDCEDEAVAALEKVERSGGPAIAFDAKMILGEWRDGSLRIV